MRGATPNANFETGNLCNFNPRTPCGVRPSMCFDAAISLTFQSTHPMRGATPLCGGSVFRSVISIHAPHAGCDQRTCFSLPSSADFNPRTPCGVRLPFYTIRKMHKKFQSTHPMRGATACTSVSVLPRIISIHAPHAGCDFHFSILSPCRLYISIHAPHAGCDIRIGTSKPKRQISIHAPHAGCDFVIASITKDLGISIHAPHAGCDHIARRYRCIAYDISIHAPHAGCDWI